MNILSKERNLEREGMLVSILGHLIFFSVIVFTFAPQSIAHKPLMVFLGSFLDPQELTHQVNPPAGPPGSPEMPLRKEPVAVGTRRSTFVPSESSGLWKPAFSQGVPAKGNKAYIKSNFLDEAAEDDNSEELLKKMGIEQKTPDYRPLQMR